MRYIIGIDLGTTNCALSYVDTQQPHLPIQSWRIPQLTSQGYCRELPTLPSFCYLTPRAEGSNSGSKLPWESEAVDDYYVGAFAKEEGAKVPMRLVYAAKSWLTHSAVKRDEKILPFDAAEEERCISPVEATARYLRHLIQAWNHTFARGDSELEMEQQQVIITVPASFDEIARGLTVEAAKRAGLSQLTLLEEPQAAFYAWISQNEKRWESLLPPGSLILVCDLGGGTTDFSLIEVKDSSGLATFERRAVGEHLLLGGDNMDRAIAHHLAEEFFSDELSSIQWMQLLHQVRAAKEALLGRGDQRFTITLQGSGSKVIQGSSSATIERSSLERLLLEGFFHTYHWSEAHKLQRDGGFHTIGLPYEREPSITKQLASFLRKSSTAENPQAPDFVLFNGGAMKPLIFQEAILTSLQNWFPKVVPTKLSNSDLDTAVARGAAYYGKVRRGLGIKIGGGIPRSYYLGVTFIDDNRQESLRALTVMPRAAEEGSSYESSYTFELQPNTPVDFQLYTSHVRLVDQVGSVIAIDDSELMQLPPIRTQLRYGKQRQGEELPQRIPVHIYVELNPIGTLDLWLKAVNSNHRWSLQFQLRTSGSADSALTSSMSRGSDERLDAALQKEAENCLFSAFNSAYLSSSDLNALNGNLEEILGITRHNWSLSVLRNLWAPLLKSAERRKLSATHEERWWNLAGFLLRPGFGFPLDDFRIKEVWKLLLESITSPINNEVQLQLWICCRRIAGGLSKGQQAQLLQPLIKKIFNRGGSKISVRGKSERYRYTELIRTLASMELIDTAVKVKLGNAIFARIAANESLPIDYWAISRLGARSLFYGCAANVLPAAQCESWVEKLLAHQPDPRHEEVMLQALAQMVRFGDMREKNISETTLQQVVCRVERSPRSEEFKGIAFSSAALTKEQREFVYGEKLPTALTLTL